MPSDAVPSPIATTVFKVIGLDLSITASGVAHSDGRLTTIAPRATMKDRRLAVIKGVITRMVRDEGPDLAVIEDLPTHAHSAGITGMVHGVARYALIETGCPYALVTPAALKKFATGRGNANKSDMRMALFKRTDADVGDDNQVDAAWLRYAGLHALGQPAFALPKIHTAGLEKVAWPAMEEKEQ